MVTWKFWVSKFWGLANFAEIVTAVELQLICAEPNLIFSIQDIVFILAPPDP